LRTEPRTTEQTMDLSAYKGLSFIVEKGLHELVQEIEKLVKHNNRVSNRLEKMTDNLSDGIWLKNPQFLITNLQLEPGMWESTALARLVEFKTLWTSIYAGKHAKLVNPFLADLKNRIGIIGAQILTISSHRPSDVPSELTHCIVEIAVKLSELGRTRFYIDGGKSIDAFNVFGNEIVNLIDQAIEQIKLYSTASDNSG